jgi:hypothetical protein
MISMTPGGSRDAGGFRRRKGCIDSQGKKKPGTIAKIFSTHPMTSDRIREVSDLKIGTKSPRTARMRRIKHRL